MLHLEKSQDSTRSTNDDMWRFWTLQYLFIFFNWNSTVEDFGNNVREMFCETKHFILDLESKFSDIAQDQSSCWLRILFKLMKNRKNKDGGLTHSRNSLANDISTLHRIRNALLLNFRWMFKTTICDCSIKLIFQQEIFKTSCMNTCISWDFSIKLIRIMIKLLTLQQQVFLS